MTNEERDEYLVRMRDSQQFRRLGIMPKWQPGKGDIEGFIHDEVVRQYHDPRVHDDGGVRVAWMMNAWSYAQEYSAKGAPDIRDVRLIGGLVEPQYNSKGFRQENVYIGKSTGAPPRMLEQLMPQLVSHAAGVEPLAARRGAHPNEYRALWQWDLLSDSDVLRGLRELMTGILTADDWYLAYEALHPWVDGNGRSGKVLHNWLLGTLNEPVLVADYFGGGNP